MFMKYKIESLVIILLVSISIIGCSSKQNEKKIKNKLMGKWEAILVYPNVKYKLVADFEKDSSNNIRMKLSSPKQKSFNLTVDSLEIIGNKISFSVKKYQVHFSGIFNVDSNKIAGTWKQTKYHLHLIFFREGELARFNRPQYPMKPYPYNSDSVAFDNYKENIKLAGTLTYPNHKGKYPAVLLLSGMGPQDRDETMYGHKPFVIVADYLTKKGFAVLRVDDRGMGKSTGNYYNSTTNDFAGDAAASIEFLKKQQMVDSTQIGLIGFNEGGLIASMVASRNRNIQFIVLLSTPGLTGEKILLAQTLNIQKKEKVPKAELTKNYNFNKKVFNIIASRKDSSTIHDELVQAYKDMIASLSTKEKYQKKYSKNVILRQIGFMSTPWFRYYLTYDPKVNFEKVKCPVLNLYGDKDIQVQPDENLAAIKNALADGGNNNVKSEVIPNVNHLFQDCQTGLPQEYSQITETFSPKVLVIIGDWIKKELAAEKGKQVAYK